MHVHIWTYVAEVSVDVVRVGLSLESGELDP